eukprot:scaffold502391_cov42-Prasinocladus_malaysianus.AAC.1
MVGLLSVGYTGGPRLGSVEPTACGRLVREVPAASAATSPPSAPTRTSGSRRSRLWAGQGGV